MPLGCENRGIRRLQTASEVSGGMWGRLGGNGGLVGRFLAIWRRGKPRTSVTAAVWAYVGRFWRGVKKRRFFAVLVFGVAAIPVGGKPFARYQCGGDFFQTDSTLAGG